MKLTSTVGLLAFLLAAPTVAQVTQRVNVSSSGAPANGSSFYGGAAISADGRYVVFGSEATNLVAGDANDDRDVFLRDRLVGTTELVSIASDGTQGGRASWVHDVSPDGRFVLFASFSTHLVPGDTNEMPDLFVRDRQLGITERVNLGSAGEQADRFTVGASISADGRYVAFSSEATNLVPNDTNQCADVFVRDRSTGVTTRVSVDSNGTQAIPYLINEQYSCDMSADGRFVAFVSEAVNLVPGDTNGGADIFVHDRTTGRTQRVSVSSTGEQQNGVCGCLDYWQWCRISADGRFVAFNSEATNLAPGDANEGIGNINHDVFVHDRQARVTERISVDSNSVGGTGISTVADLSADGRYVLFNSSSRNLVDGDSNGNPDLFVRDRAAAITERVNLAWDGGQSGASSLYGTISADGRYVAFLSFAGHLVPNDPSGGNVYVRDRFGGTNFTSTCDPGVGGVIACPCSNPPSGTGRGCNNSANTGGAVLSASGGASLSSDSLVFTTSGEKPTSLSVVRQWTGSNPTGVVFGQGVRCTSGTVKRMYTKSAVGGSITAPDFSAGDPQVSVRSAAVGDTILAGQSRWYFVYYRDGVVLGGCPSVATFNTTQTGVVTWSP